MAFARTCFVLVFALAALFGGAVEAALADHTAAGIGRSQPCDVDPAALESADDTDSDDADHDPHAHDWLACGSLSPGVRRSGVVQCLDPPADIASLRRPRSTASIRGPPVRR